MHYLPLLSFDNYIEAHIYMTRLQDERINCWLKDELTVTIDPLLSHAVGGIKLMVHEAQLPRAASLLDAWKKAQ